jgi:hypothetical protein
LRSLGNVGYRVAYLHASNQALIGHQGLTAQMQAVDKQVKKETAQASACAVSLLVLVVYGNVPPT